MGQQHCDRFTGQCQCLPNVVGVRCDRCEENHWKIASGEGCEPCGCDEIGAYDNQCNPVSKVNNILRTLNKINSSSMTANVHADLNLVEELVINVRLIPGVIPMLNAKVCEKINCIL